MEFPSEEATFNNDEAFMVGNSILVQGIYTEVQLWAYYIIAIRKLSSGLNH